MSGFIRKRGTYELTVTKAAYWWRSARGGDAFPGLGAVASVLANAGFEVVAVHDAFLVVRAGSPRVERAIYAAFANG